MALAPSAQALGIGRLQAPVTLGQPLQLSVPVRLEAGDAVESGCVHADVQAGDSRWAQDALRVRLEPTGGTQAAQATVVAEGPGQWLLRISSSTVVEEPVLEVTVTLGCERRLSRRFTVLADPPGSGPLPMAAPVAAAPADPVRDSAVPAVRAERRAPASRAVRAPMEGTAAGQAGSPPRSRAPSRPASASPDGRREPRTRAARERDQASAGRDGGPRLLLEMAPPQLKLDMEEPIFMPAPASSPSVAEGVTDAQRLAMLERTLRELQKEGRTGQDVASALRARLETAEAQGRAVPWLAAALALAVAVAGWLAWRMRQANRASPEQAPTWWAESRAAEAAPAAVDELGPVEFVPPSDLGRLDEAPPAADAPVAQAVFSPPTLPQPLSAVAPVEPPAERTVAELPRLPVEAAGAVEVSAEAATVREVSVEELLDLEQQADFFIALGQEDAAVDLLMSHLRSTGGMSPLPYTKLLEIYHRQNDPDGYERIRTRFNRRFNAYAPDWAQGPVAGRHLEDYPEVIARLQACWDDPVEAMALLEAMLFRRADVSDLFDLPAYRDVLLLYSLARDVAQHSGIALPSVDVLLPLVCDNPDEADGPLR